MRSDSELTDRIMRNAQTDITDSFWFQDVGTKMIKTIKKYKKYELGKPSRIFLECCISDLKYATFGP